MAWDQYKRSPDPDQASRIRQLSEQRQQEKRSGAGGAVSGVGGVLGGLLSLIPGVGPVIGGAVTAGSSLIGKGISGGARGAASGAGNFISALTALYNPYGGSGYGGGGNWQNQVGGSPY